MRSSRDELSECIRLSQPKREDAKKAKVRKGFLGDIFATFASSRLALRLRRSRSRYFVCFVMDSTLGSRADGLAFTTQLRIADARSHARTWDISATPYRLEPCT